MFRLFHGRDDRPCCSERPVRQEELRVNRSEVAGRSHVHSVGPKDEHTGQRWQLRRGACGPSPPELHGRPVHVERGGLVAACLPGLFTTALGDLDPFPPIGIDAWRWGNQRRGGTSRGSLSTRRTGLWLRHSAHPPEGVVAAQAPRWIIQANSQDGLYGRPSMRSLLAGADSGPWRSVIPCHADRLGGIGGPEGDRVHFLVARYHY